MYKVAIAAMLAMSLSPAYADTTMMGGNCASNNFYPTVIAPQHLEAHIVVIAIPGPGLGQTCFQLSPLFRVGQTVEIYAADPSVPYYNQGGFTILDEYATADVNSIGNHRIAGSRGIFLRKVNQVPGGYNWGFINSLQNY